MGVAGETLRLYPSWVHFGLYSVVMRDFLKDNVSGKKIRIDSLIRQMSVFYGKDPVAFPDGYHVEGVERREKSLVLPLPGTEKWKNLSIE